MCNYGRGGNRLRRKVYQPGSPCSACPAHTTCSSSYTGLCSTRHTTTIPINNNNNNKELNTKIRPVNRRSKVRDQSILFVNNNNNRVIRTNVTTRVVSRPRVGGSLTRYEPRRQPRLTRVTTGIRQRYNTSCNNILCQIARIFQ